MQYQPAISRDDNGIETPVAVPVMRQDVIDRINKVISKDRQRLFVDGDRVVWIDLRAAKEIDVEEYARRHGHMDPTEKMLGT